MPSPGLRGEIRVPVGRVAGENVLRADPDEVARHGLRRRHGGEREKRRHESSEYPSEAKRH